MSRIIHPIEPVYDSNSRILILGSFPSVKSREEGFFYGHPQNRFWKVMAAVFEDSLPVSIPEKRDFLIRNGVALWDVIASCEITGSSDASIKNVKVNDLSRVLDNADIKGIFVNGKTAEKMFKRYGRYRTVPCLLLPSTSPANAAWSLERLTEEWRRVILPFIWE
ncbi:MAG: DNA-deoxyinosine glycosylase [Lachnospiraceae bacterium]|nr:DNA-deoxyinosine glycosylase [Lachnospiraceae bacterium]